MQRSRVHRERFIEHQSVPLLDIDLGSRRPAWQQVVEAIGDAIRSGMLAAGEPLPSVREMSALQNVPVATLQHALAVLADEGLVVLRQGRTAVVAGDAGLTGDPAELRATATMTASAPDASRACASR